MDCNRFFLVCFDKSTFGITYLGISLEFPGFIYKFHEFLFTLVDDFIHRFFQVSLERFLLRHNWLCIPTRYLHELGWKKHYTGNSFVYGVSFISLYKNSYGNYTTMFSKKSIIEASRYFPDFIDKIYKEILPGTPQSCFSYCSCGFVLRLSRTLTKIVEGFLSKNTSFL